MADEEKFEYVQVTEYTNETITSPTYYDESEWKTYQRDEQVGEGEPFQYIDDIDSGGVASA